MRTDSGLFQFSVFSRLPLGGRLLAKQDGEGCRYPHPCKQSGEQLQHLLSPFSLFLLREKSAKKPTVAGRAASNREPREVCFNSPSFRGFPLGGRLLAKQGGEGCRYPHPCKQSDEQLQLLLSPLGRVASNREPREVCLKLISPACLPKVQFFKPFKMQKKYLQ